METGACANGHLSITYFVASQAPYFTLTGGKEALKGSLYPRRGR